MSKDNNFVVKRNLILPTLKLEVGVPVYIKVISKIRQGKEIANSAKEKVKPADICDVINLETGEEMQLVVAAIVKSTFEEDLKGVYEGLCFMIEKGDKKQGKRYFTYKISEIEVPKTVVKAV